MIGANNTVSTQRRTVSPTGKESWDGSNIITGARVYLEQLSPDMAASLDGQFTYDLYRIYFDGTVDLEEGDTVTDNQSRVFSVKGVEKYPNDEIEKHTEAVLMLKGTDEN